MGYGSFQKGQLHLLQLSPHWSTQVLNLLPYFQKSIRKNNLRWYQFKRPLPRMANLLRSTKKEADSKRLEKLLKSELGIEIEYVSK